MNKKPVGFNIQSIQLDKVYRRSDSSMWQKHNLDKIAEHWRLDVKHNLLSEEKFAKRYNYYRLEFIDD